MTSPKRLTRQDAIQFGKFFGLLLLTAAAFQAAADYAGDRGLDWVSISIILGASVVSLVLGFLVVRKPRTDRKAI